MGIMHTRGAKRTARKGTDVPDEHYRALLAERGDLHAIRERDAATIARQAADLRLLRARVIADDRLVAELTDAVAGRDAEIARLRRTARERGIVEKAADHHWGASSGGRD